MTIAEAVAKSVKSLPPDKQREVMDFAEFLKAHERPRPKRSVDVLKGLWAGIGIDISDEDIQEARREMWAGGNFPPDIENYERSSG